MVDLSTARTTLVPRRDEVLAGLVTLFLAEGFAHLGVADLARRLQCSKSTLYAVAPTKEQIVVAVVRTFFRTATARVEAVLAAAAPDARIPAYLEAIARELQPAGPAFIADVEANALTNELYRRNTEAAAGRVRELVQAQPADDRLDPVFVGAVAGLVMQAIQRGDLARGTGLDHSSAYAALSALLGRGDPDH